MRFIRGMLALIAFVGYILYQLLVKKKPLSALKNDMIAIAFFAAIWGGLYYWMSN